MESSSCNREYSHIAVIACAIVIAIALAGTTACSPKQQDSTPIPQSQPVPTETYSNAYFSVRIPDAWVGKWSVREGQESRPSMGATNHIYTFVVDGSDYCSLSCRSFNLGGGERIGSLSDGTVLEFSPTSHMSDAECRDFKAGVAITR